MKIHQLHPFRLTNAVLILAFALPAVVAAAESSERKPNILFILSDDQGYSDLGLRLNRDSQATARRSRRTKTE